MLREEIHHQPAEFGIIIDQQEGMAG